jgi:hypothetical protein
VWSLARELWRVVPVAPSLFREIRAFASEFRFELSTLLVISAYAFGHIFYRMDPSRPDEVSAQRIIAGYTLRDRADWVVQQTGGGKVKVQFPYHYLHNYLDARGLGHLAQLVPWRGGDPESYRRRSKNFINILKLRVRFYFPERCDQIIRNEAHVRLMASLWHSLVVLQHLAILGVLVELWVPTLLEGGPSERFLKECLLAMAVTAAFLLPVLLARFQIERFFHYMRVREIVHVLEVAYLASLEKPEVTSWIPQGEPQPTT